MRGESEHGGQDGCVVGETKSREAAEPSQRSRAKSKDEVDERCEQDAAHAHGGRRIEGAVISGYHVLDKGYLPCEMLKLGPKIPAYRSLLLVKPQSGTLIPSAYNLNLTRTIRGSDMASAHTLQAGVPVLGGKADMVRTCQYVR